MKRLSAAMQRALVGVRDHGDATHGLRGRSEHGGLSRTLAALSARGLLVRGTLTDAGRAAIAHVALGPSNDDSPAVEVEMRAAEIAACYVPDLADALTSGTDDEAIGWSLHRDATTTGSGVVGELHEAAIDDGVPRTDDARSGWLAREIYDVVHDIEYEYDTAWAWDRSRPLAAQLAATETDDAAADALVEEFSKPVDGGTDGGS